MSADVQTLIHRDFPAARRGDREAFSRLVAATQRMVASVALAVTRDIQASQDVAQDTFLTAWERLGQMRNPDSFLPWLRQVARNRAIDQVRAVRQRGEGSGGSEELAGVAEPGRGPAESLVAEQEAALLARAIEQVPDDSREVLLLYYSEGQSTRAVAALLGLGDDAVRKRLERAREYLREEVLAGVASTVFVTAPSAAFTAAVGSSLAAAPGAASAAAAIGAKAWGPKVLLGAVGSLFASIGLVVGAVWIEMRGYLRRARTPAERRALRANGLVYAGLMATYMVVLWWSARDGWTLGQTLAAAVAFAAAIIALAVRRARILPKDPSSGPP